MTIKTSSEKETFNLGKKIAKKLKGSDVVCLTGKLGAGKTVLIKGIARGLGIKEIINSPTFILMKIYKTRINADKNADLRGLKNKINYLCHIDAYRLKTGKDLIAIGVNDWLGRRDVLTVIEWAEKVKDILPKKKKSIRIKLGNKKNERKINLSAELR